MPTDPPDVSDLITEPDGFPRPDWVRVAERIDLGFRPDDRPAGWASATRQWLSAVAARIGESFGVFESDHFQVMMVNEPDVAGVLLRFAEHTRRSLLDLFPEVARFVEPGKHAVLAFPDPRLYYAYVEAFYPEEGEFGGSGGMHVPAGYPHIVIWGQQVIALQAILAHELTHAAFHHLGSPAWLEEGITQLVAHAAVGRPGLELTADGARRHKRLWATHGLGPFWWGAGFHRPGGLQQVSYELAEILLRLLIEEHRPGFFGKGKRERLVEFLRHAKATDAGQAAAVEHLRFSLGELASRFLGPGEWEPNRADRDAEPGDRDAEPGDGLPPARRLTPCR
jgi:hypothetical protein